MHLHEARYVIRWPRWIHPGHQDHGNDHQQEPGPQLADPDELPATELIGIGPGIRPGGDVLGEPDEQGNQHEGDHQRHSQRQPEDPERHPTSTEQHQHGCDQHPAGIPDVVVCEEVQIDQPGQHHRDPAAGIAREPQIEQPEHPHHVRADRGIHEPAVQRHAAQAQQPFALIDPRADTGLEQLHPGTDQVEQHHHP